ncbi:MAG: sigma 54-interacting transcriptional regulator, partial [Elusimicrobia bacterium]|nr:sigma 54-interacting transcriptional regulator [Candidatus Obscuribacterium magneticum]
PNGICSSLCTFCHANTDMISSPSEISDTNLKSYETDFTTKDGEDRKFKISLSPVYLGPGKATGVIATIRNITEISAMRWKLEEKHSFHGMVGRSTRMQDIFEIIRQTSSTNYPVLISGESGTGKELTAMAIHHESSRKGAPFMPINCGALPENILESELFGHVRGAFTGAIRDKKGRFELADKGTLFLDEIGELSPAFQVKLLRVLQEKRFERVGGEKTISVDVRIIAATNRDLQKMINDNTFREDLFYRLSVIPINLPPLRNRHEDLPGIVDQILKEIGSETGRQSMKISNEAMDVLLSYSWPGNIRQLINALQFASIRTGENYLLPEHLPPEIRGSVADLYQNHFINDGGSRIKLTRKSVKKALFETSGNKVNAAKLLGVGRATLYRFLDKNPL